MRANYPRRNTGKKKDKVLTRYTNECIALCVVYGVEKAKEMLQEKHEGRKHYERKLYCNRRKEI